MINVKNIIEISYNTESMCFSFFLLSFSSVQCDTLHPCTQIAAIRFHNNLIGLIVGQQILRRCSSAQVGAVYGGVKTGMRMLAGKYNGRLQNNRKKMD